MSSSKKKHTFRRNSKGMTSILMVMLAAAITGLVVLTASRTLLDLGSVFQSAETELNIALSVQDFQRVLGNSADCTASILSAGALSTTGPKALPNIVNSSVTNVCGGLPCNITVGLPDINNKYHIGRMVVDDYAPNPAGCDIGRPTDQCSTPTLKIRLDKTGSASKTNPTLERNIPLEVRTNAANVVTFCFAMLDREFISTDKFVNESGDTMTGALNINFPPGGPLPRGLFINNAFIQAAGIYIDSDSKLKSNIHKIKNPLQKIAKLEGKEFVWKSSGEKDFGFIAQDVEESIPELVQTSPDTKLKSLKYTSLIPLTLEAIKAMSAENEILNRRLAHMNQAMDRLEETCLLKNPRKKQ